MFSTILKVKLLYRKLCLLNINAKYETLIENPNVVHVWLCICIFTIWSHAKCRCIINMLDNYSRPISRKDKTRILFYLHITWMKQPNTVFVSLGFCLIVDIQPCSLTKLSTKRYRDIFWTHRPRNRRLGQAGNCRPRSWAENPSGSRSTGAWESRLQLAWHWRS